jgi:hypothetical protein
MTSPRVFGVLEGSPSPSLRHSGAVPRLRPGDYPVWCELDLSSDEQVRLRRRAHDHGVGADALVGLALEHLQLGTAVGGKRLASLVAIAARQLDRPTIGGAPELHAWRRLLEGKSQPPSDELPSICVPLRLLSQIPPRSRVEALQAAVAIDDRDLAAAFTLEAIAARHGMMMGFWALCQPC